MNNYTILANHAWTLAVVVSLAALVSPWFLLAAIPVLVLVNL